MSKSVLFRFIILALFIASGSAVKAQPPVLPDIIAATDKGVNVISWTCQYDGIKSIAVQRSSDSVFNYTTVGYVKNLKKGTQAFIDGHPNAGSNWYRLYIAFSSDLTWYSNNIKVSIDSATLLEKGVIPPNDSLQKYASSVKIDPADIIASSLDNNNSSSTTTGTTGNTTINTGTTATATTNPTKSTPKLNLDIPMGEENNQMTYIKSRHVFTNPFTGHVTLELPQDTRQVFSIDFYKQGDERTPVLSIPRLRKTNVIIDKRNFQGKGVYKFILNQGTDKLEEGYISIY